MSLAISIIIPTKDRAVAVQALLDSIKRLQALERLRPEIIIGDNDSRDNTWNVLREASHDLPVPLKLLKVEKPGKSVVINRALRVASGKILAFLDDDVMVDTSWLEGIERFFHAGSYQVGQGIIRIASPEGQDPKISCLIERYRTIPRLDYKSPVQSIRFLNGANFAVRREALERVGFFDERLGPGASGTSEDTELARRLRRAGIAIGYMREAIAYHRVDRARLTDQYFKSIHTRQGKSRLLIKNRSVPHILFELCRTAAQYGIASLIGKERRRYRSKGRIYHYLGMLEAKRNGQPKR